jgi:hypothetical protein
MASEKMYSEQNEGAGRTEYEPPAIVQTASFERLSLACLHTPAEYKAGGCGSPAPDTANS